MVSRKKRMKASDTRLFKELYSVEEDQQSRVQLVDMISFIIKCKKNNKKSLAECPQPYT